MGFDRIGLSLTNTTLMEPGLIRRAARLGLHFEPMGPAVECSGTRIPCGALITQLIEGARNERPDVWRIVTDNGRLSEQFLVPLAAE